MISLNINSKLLTVYYEEFSLVDDNDEKCTGCFFDNDCGRIVYELNTFNDGGCVDGMIYKFIGSESRAKIILDNIMDNDGEHSNLKLRHKRWRDYCL